MTTEAVPPMTAAQLAEVRSLIEQQGFLPMTPKAMRLFAAAERKSADRAGLAALKEMFQEAGYLPRSKALKLVDLAR